MRTVVALAMLCACAIADDPPAAIARIDRATQRAHAWDLWSRVLRDWPHYVPSDVLLGARDRVFRPLRPFRVGNVTETETLPIMFAVAFDPTAAAHIRSQALASRATLRRLDAFPAFPPSALAIKLIWYPVHRDRPAQLPVWDGEPMIPTGNPDRTWQRTITIDPSEFITRTLTRPDELAAARAIAHDPSLAPGDLAILLGMHVSTKELPDWIWATDWWHDRPNLGPYAANRPASLAGPAAHYLMDVAYSGEAPCMNPFLEARFPDGVHSNCLTCHQRAASGAVDYLPVTRSVLAPDDPYFAGKLPTDFVWTLALEAR